MFILVSLGFLKYLNLSKVNNETLIAGSEGFNELRVFDVKN